MLEEKEQIQSFNRTAHMHLALLKVVLILTVLRNLRKEKVLKVDNVFRSCKPI